MIPGFNPPSTPNIDSRGTVTDVDPPATPWPVADPGGWPQPSQLMTNVTAPTDETDFSMFADGEAPVDGHYTAITKTRAWYFIGGWDKWRFANLMLSDE